MNHTPSHEQIALLAFERYAARGYQNGHDVDDWYWAETSLLAEVGKPAVTPPPVHAPAPAPAPAHEHGHHHGHDHHQHGAHDTRHRH
jgi:hypothetical protein